MKHKIESLCIFSHVFIFTMQSSFHIRLRARKFFPFLIQLFFLSAILPANENPTFRFLRNDVGARAAALGGGLLTTADEINAMFYNPATLATLSHSRASFGYNSLLLDVSEGHASYGLDIPEFGYLGAGILFTNYGSFTRTNNSGTQLDEFSALDIAFISGIATKLEHQLPFGGNFFVGGNVKIISSSIADYSSSAFAIDAGLLYQFSNKRTAMAFSILNVGTQLSSFINTREPLPLDVKFAFTHRPERLPVNLHLTFFRLNHEGNISDKLRAFSVGGEFKIGPYLRARLGYNNLKRQELKLSSGVGLAGFSLGTGIVYENFTFDFGTLMYGVMGSQSYFTLGIQL
ncbi:MAG: PorV/PorQ family protein [Ignavibacteria bacterium]|nr:PorV/PorQ family protein [Ignavibacteria bacterium]